MADNWKCVGVGPTFEKQHRVPKIRGPIARCSWRSKELGLPVHWSYSVEGDRIYLPGSQGGIQFPFPIGDVVETEGAIVICLAIPSGRRFTENVFGIDLDGNLLWRVRPQILSTRTGQYVGVSIEGHFVRLHSKDGQWSDVEPRSGSPPGRHRDADCKEQQ